MEHKRGELEGIKVKTCTNCRDDNDDEKTKEVKLYVKHKLFLHWAYMLKEMQVSNFK